MNESNPILIIDDDPVIRKLLSVILIQAGYQISEASKGQEGIELASRNLPALILLDIMMPEMNGFEVIQQLKSNQATSEIPVIFLSAKAESTDKVRGLELGASDFVNKPFDRGELLARIATQIKLKQQEAALKHYSANLEKMVEERTQQLIHADRLASLGTLSAGIAHEINNPTTFIVGNIQTLESFWKIMLAYLEKHLDTDPNQKISYIINEFPSMIDSIRTGAGRISNIVLGLKTFSRKDSVIKKPVDVGECLKETLQLVHNRLKYNIDVQFQMDPDLPSAWANAQQLVQVLVNLILNAADAIGEKPGWIRITGRHTPEDTIRITVSDSGHGMSPEIRQNVFNPFFTTKPVGQGTGLGLSITLGIIQDHHGTIELTSEPNEGTTFTFTLPTEPKQ